LCRRDPQRPGPLSLAIDFPTAHCSVDFSPSCAVTAEVVRFEKVLKHDFEISGNLDGALMNEAQVFEREMPKIARHRRQEAIPPTGRNCGFRDRAFVLW
jgi:hypothetical protein